MFDFEKNSKVIITEKLKARFCKDMNYSIKVYVEPYFENFIRLFDKQYNSIEKYRAFVETVQMFGSEEAYFAAYDKVKDDAISYLNNNPTMDYFSKEENMNKFACVNRGFASSNIYSKNNDGLVFVSIDMKKANFTALHHYSTTIVENKRTYEEFLGMFTDVPHFINSKYIRQVIFGNINPKRQVTYEKYLMDMVLTKLLEVGNIKREDICSLSTDEIVIKVSDGNKQEWPDGYVKLNTEYVEAIEKVVKYANDNNIFVRSEYFVLRAIPGCKGFVKKFIYNREGIEFKCLDSLTMPFVLRAYNGEKVTDLDRVFYYEGKKAMLMEDYEIEVV